jgi:hypothetical protein
MFPVRRMRDINFTPCRYAEVDRTLIGTGCARIDCLPEKPFTNAGNQWLFPMPHDARLLEYRVHSGVFPGVTYLLVC